MIMAADVLVQALFIACTGTKGGLRTLCNKGKVAHCILGL